MRPSHRRFAWIVCCFAYACGDAGALGTDGSELQAQDAENDAYSAASTAAEAKPEDDAEGSVELPAEDDLSIDDLACPHGGQVGRVRVDFECGQITTVSCKDLSNVVVEFADGTRQRFEGLSGQSGTFAGTGVHAGAVITRVWVKAGANHSGEGPGYGERFDAPSDSCSEQPPADDCIVPDGTCTPGNRPPPPEEEECFVADGSCTPGKTPPMPPVEEPEMVI